MRVSAIAVRRVWYLALALVLATPLSVAAAPFVLEFEGYLRDFEITTSNQLVGGDQEVSTDRPSGITFVGTTTFDGARLTAATTGTWRGIDGELYRDEDPANAAGPDAGIETSEWMRTSMTLSTATPVTLEFNRDITNDAADATAFTRPYEGNQTLFYQEGSAYAPPRGDVFAFELRNRLTFTSTAGDAPTHYTRAYDSWIYTAIRTGMAFPPYGSFEIIDLFGPGTPMAFLWEDANPEDDLDGRATLGPVSWFSHSTTLSAFDPDFGLFRVVTTTYRGNLVMTRMQLRAVDPVQVPEPATGLLLLGSVLAATAVRRRRLHGAADTFSRRSRG